jgi:hypothetical protein
LGPVFRAYDPDRDRLVAIKLFRLDLPPERVHQLVTEFEHLIDIALDHPVIAAPLAAGMEGVNAYLVQEYVAADSLDVVIREGGQAPVADALGVLTRLAGALDYAAERHVVHGTLHPRDVLLSPDDFRLVGLGVARALECIGVPAPIRRPYTAPERIAGGTWDRRADVFSLAAVIYELVWGRRVSGSGAQAAAAIPESTAGDAAAVRDTFARALADAMSERFPTATAFAGALDAAFTGRLAKVSRMVRRTAPRPSAEPLLPLEESTLPDLRLREPGPSAMPVTSPASLESLTPAERAEEETEQREEERDAASEPEVETIVRLESRRDARIFAYADDDIEPPAHERIEAVAAGLPEPEVIESPQSSSEERIAPGDLLGIRGAARHEEESREPATLAASAAEFDAESPVMAAGVLTAVPAAEASTASLVWPLLLAGIVGVALGFGAGYAVAIRDRPVVQAGAAPPIEPAAPETAPAAAHEFQGGNVESRPLPPPTVSPSATAAAAPARPAPVAPLFAGRVLVRSTPPGARVFVDGKSGGETPATVRDLARGPHQVRIVHEGYTTVERRVTITAAQPAVTVMVPMVKTPAAAAARTEASLVIDSRPAGASVFLDGRPVGMTPLTFPVVAIGSHSIRIVLDGYRPWTSSVQVSGSEPNRVTASLEQ